MNEFAIRCENLHKEYKLGKVTIEALRGLDLKIKKGEFVAIVGVSGSGKSTLMHLMGALDTPSNGKVAIGEKELSKISDKELTMLRSEKIGFVFQTFNLFPAVSALDNVEIVMRFSNKKIPKKQRQQKAKELLEMVGLGDRMNHKPSELSGGERQRVAIARSLANDPEIILADEPTGNLDSKTSKEIIQLLKNLNKEKGITVVVVTHDPRIAREAERTITMMDGRIF
jgi:putative ABC transport system ATP-binding protein